MNKKLLALAIGAAVAMPVAALADGPTLYGKVNLSLESQTTNAGAVGGSPDNENWVLANNASRIGLKGTADTSGSLKGIYNAEFGFDADGDGAAGATFTNRETFVGLTGDFGTVKVGQFFSPFQNAQGVVDRFDDTTVDMAGYATGESTAVNAVQYTSPKLGENFTVTIASVQGEGVAAGTPPNNYDGLLESLSASVVYEGKTWYFALAMDKDMIEAPAAGFGLLAGGTPIDATRLVGAYTADNVSFGALYQMSEDATAGGSENTAAVLSGTYKADALTWKLQYGMAESENGAASREGTLIALGADYAVGKSTTITGFIAQADGIFDSVAANPTGSGIVGASSDDAEAMILSLGISQLF